MKWVNMKLSKERILIRVLQENKGRHIFRKTNISYPQINTRACTYLRLRNVCFSEYLVFLVFLKHLFWDSLFCLIANKLMLLIRICHQLKYCLKSLMHFKNQPHQLFSNVPPSRQTFLHFSGLPFFSSLQQHT